MLNPSRIAAAALLVGTATTLAGAQQAPDTVRLLMALPAATTGCSWQVAQRSASGVGLTLTFTGPDSSAATSSSAGAQVAQEGAPKTASTTSAAAARAPRATAGVSTSGSGSVFELASSAGSAPVEVRCAPSPAKSPRIGGSVSSTFTIATGAEFASANGFRSKSVTVPAVATWQAPVGNSDRMLRWLLGTNSDSNRAMSMLEITAEGGSVVVPQAFTGCLPTAGSPVIVGTADTLSTNAAIARNDCRIRQLTKLSDSLYGRTEYAEQPDARQADTTATSGYAWRMRAVYRIEFRPPNSAANVRMGPAAMAALSTNPAGASVNTLGTSWAGGVSFRDLGGSDATDFQLLVLWGTTHVFRQSVQTEYAHPFSSSDSTIVVTREALPPMTDHGWDIRLLLSPGGGFSVRGAVEINQRTPGFATIAILKSIDFTAAMKMLGIAP